MVPKGRNETVRGNLMDWVKRHDRYPDDGRTGTAAPGRRLTQRLAGHAPATACSGGR